MPAWLVLPVCPSPWRMFPPDSHPHGHGQLSASFQAGASLSPGGGDTVCRPAKPPQEGLGYPPLPNPSLSGLWAAKPLSVPPGSCPPSLRPPSSVHGCLPIAPCLPSRDHPGDTAGDWGWGGRRRHPAAGASGGRRRDGGEVGGGCPAGQRRKWIPNVCAGGREGGRDKAQPHSDPPSPAVRLLGWGGS